MATAVLIVEKECTKCGKVLPCVADYFDRDSQQQSGFYPSCKACRKRVHDDHVEEIKNQHKTGVIPIRSATTICIRCHEKLPFTRDFFAVDHSHPSGLRPYCKQCIRKDNNSRTYAPEYRHAVSKKYRDGTARFGEAVKTASRRAEKLEVVNTLTELEWRSKVELLGLKCQICGNICTLERKQPNSLSLEHKIPCSRGGNNAIDNVVPACLACNRMKGELTIEEFRLWLTKVKTFLEEKC